MPRPDVCLTIGRDSPGRFPILPLQETAAFLSDQHAPMFQVRLYQSTSPHLTKQRDRKAISVLLVILEEKEPPAFDFNRRKAQFPAGSQPPQDLPKESAAVGSVFISQWPSKLAAPTCESCFLACLRRLRPRSFRLGAGGRTDAAATLEQIHR